MDIKRHPLNPNLTATLLVLVSLASSAVGFLTSILIARWLGADGYQEFSVAIAGLMLVTTFCEFGTGKYALRIIPEYQEQQHWGLLHGYYRFSFGLVLIVGLLTGAAVLLTGRLLPGIYNNPLILLAVFFIPTTALLSVAAEFVMSNRMPIAGGVITRLLCPLLMLAMLGSIYLLQGRVTPTETIASFGISGIAGLVIAAFLTWYSAGKAVWTSTCEYHLSEWLKYGLWYLLFAFVTSWIFRISLLVLHTLDVADLEIARFAAALEVASLVIILAKSTNKFYQPELALIMTSGDWALAMRMRRYCLNSVMAAVSPAGAVAFPLLT